MVRRYIWAILLLAGCSDDPVESGDVVGSYRIDERSHAACGETAEPTAVLGYIDVTATDTGIVVSTCATDTQTCDAWMELANAGDRWAGDLATAQVHDTRNCALLYKTFEAKLSGQQLQIDETSYATDFFIDGSDCTPDMARERGTTMHCGGHDEYVATPSPLPF